MARKKNRSYRPGSRDETAIMPQAAVTGMTATPPGKTLTVSAPPSAAKVRRPERSWLESSAIAVAHQFGSLQVAVFGLSVFAVVLMIGTMVESWYTGKIAQELVYRTWWFTLLLFVLGINIFFAAVKKWPW